MPAPKRRPQGSGGLRKRGDRWQSSVVDPRTGRTLWHTWPAGTTRRQAEHNHQEWSAEISKRRPADRTVTVAAYLTSWLGIRQADMTPATHARHAANARVLEREIGGVRLAELDPLALTETFAVLARTYSPASVKSLRATANAALGDAVRWERLPSNPMTAVRLPRPPAKQDRATPTTEQVHALCATETDELWRVVWEVLAGTGARPGEVLALHWRDVDLRKGTVQIGRTLTQDGRRTVMGDTTKTRRARRIAIDPHLVSVLTAGRRTLRDEELARAGKDAPLFPSPLSGSGVVSQGALAARFRAGMRRVGADENITPHAVRHWFISTWMAQGWAAQTIAAHCGNSIEQVMQRYGVHAPDHALAEVAARMPARNGGTS